MSLGIVIKNETQASPPPQSSATASMILCTSPYTVLNNRCCLDKNTNNICDENEGPQPDPTKTDKEPLNSSIPETDQVFVSKVIDGDTIELKDGSRVRLLGINTPEKGELYYQEARNKLKELVEGKKVILESDKEDTDRYGRLLRYVFVDDSFVNVELVQEGYAIVYIIKPNTKYEKELREAWEMCLADKIGICKPPKNSLCDDKCLGISYFHFDARGDDRENLNDEYVTVKNTCDYSCDMTDWSIIDEADHEYIIPKFILEKEGVFTLYTGSGQNTGQSLYWGSGAAIWNNNGDTLYLWNSDGELVLDYHYSGR